MSKITTLNEKAIAVEVPPKAVNHHVSIMDLRDREFALSYRIDGEYKHIDLPNPGPKPWKIEGIPNMINSGILEKIFPHPSLSGISAMRECLESKGLNPESIIILIKQ